jgi:hypothetical protein
MSQQPTKMRFSNSVRIFCATYFYVRVEGLSISQLIKSTCGKILKGWTMILDNDVGPVGSVEQFPVQPHSRAISDELNMIARFLRQACPLEAKVSFDFDVTLRVHIDVRNLEDVTKVEALLPTLGASMFRAVNRGLTPRRSFFHRVTAQIDR